METKMEMMEKKANQRQVKIGDVFVNSWGYDQTNIDYFQVVGLTAKSVKLQAIESNEIERPQTMTGDSTPKIDFFKKDSNVFTKRVYLYDDVPHVNMDNGSCELWDGTIQHWTGYC